MSASAYLSAISSLLSKIEESELPKIQAAARACADSIEKGGWVYSFGSGHSVIPVMDVFPRYGSFVGFMPITDPRLMWTSVLGPGGAPGILWLERQEGYVATLLSGYVLRPEDTLIVYSHGGLNAAPVEAAAYARRSGTTVIAVTSGDNHVRASATHSSGKKLGDLADVLIDNCVPLEDALVSVDGVVAPVGAGSTVAVTAITSALVAEVAAELARRGRPPVPFASPNIHGIPPSHNEGVFEAFRLRVAGSAARGAKD
ncbi:sugar isomerase domain-containing protein [Limnochorda pilosa]|uniref:SIS domain-containing protein n=1 Tax=Limnochorda pilosa TaxID=1555112 RepID=A0A0K2SGY5_LIMPI|nr:sugar isomerase domain-containing protein [Limnochorda pilosa]BAS26373.1 hypothetical protein LIP_0516 [Limnochorda pilosa]